VSAVSAGAVFKQKGQGKDLTLLACVSRALR